MAEVSEEDAYDWQSMDRNEFLYWLLPILLSEPLTNEKFKELSAATDHFTKVALQVSINGVEVNGNAFFRRMGKIIQGEIERGASRLVQEKLDDMRISIDDIVESARSAIFDALEAKGITVTRDED